MRKVTNHNLKYLIHLDRIKFKSHFCLAKVSMKGVAHSDGDNDEVVVLHVPTGHIPTDSSKNLS